MELYAIIGFVLLLLGFAVWLAVHLSGRTRDVERAEHRADAESAARKQAEENAEWTNAERDRQLEAAARIRDKIRAGAKKPTEPILPAQSKSKSGAGLALMGFALLVSSIGCARTVYVEAKPPHIPVPTVPAMDDSKEEWQVFGLVLLETVQRYNDEVAQ